MSDQSRRPRTFHRKLAAKALLYRGPALRGVSSPAGHRRATSYIQPNAPSRIAYIALDVDRQGAAYVAEDAGLPWPTFTVINPKTTHAHLLYELSAPVYSGRSDKADRFLNAVRGGLTETLGADSAYRGPLVQNPLHYCWRKIVTEISSPWRISPQAYQPSCCDPRGWPPCRAGSICRAATSACLRPPPSRLSRGSGSA